MKYSIVLLCLIFSLVSCRNPGELIDQIQGEWTLTGTSGTVSGGGINTLWNEISIEDNSFDLINVDAITGQSEVIASGEFVDMGAELFDVRLSSTTIDDLAIELDPEKMISVTANQMDWASPCCDRINYHFISK